MVSLRNGKIMRAFWCVAALLASWTIGQDQQPSSEMIRMYLRQSGQSGSNSQIQKAMNEYRAQKEGKPAIGDSAAQKAAESAADSTDTTGLLPEKSVYQNILARKFADPDKMINKLEPFGYSFFDRARPSTFAPTDKMSVPSSYPISSGDEIIVTLWGRMNEEYRLKVDRDGKVAIPHIGPVNVAGQPFSSMEKNILDRVQNIEGVQASVSMGDLRSIQVFIVGEVRSPGQYTVSALSSVTNALYAAGGPTRQGSLRMIQLKRNGALVANVDFYDLLLSGQNSSDIRLKDGDVIMVPVAQKMAAIAGNVRRSALYELKGKTTLKELINLAGGVTPAAWVNRIQVERFNDNQLQNVLDLEAGSAQDIPQFEVQDADIVKIFPIVMLDENTVYLSGNVKRPGKYEYRKGMKVSDVVPDYDAVMTETYLEYAIVKRRQPPSFLDAILPFNLKSAIDDKAGASNLALEPRDEIVIFHRDFFEPDRYVSIDGAVNTPGTQKLLENMTIRDLIIQAGGLREDASPNRGELYRRVTEGETVRTQELQFCVQCAMNNEAEHNLALQRFDRIFIRTKIGWEEEKKVVLKGEFVFPGQYVLLEGETLGKLMDRAGGFTKSAYLAASVLTRESVRILEKQRLEEYARQLEMDIVKLSAEMSAKEKNAEAEALLIQQRSVLDKIRAIQPSGRVVIDMTQPGSYASFALEDRDTLIIPREMHTVSVLGEVFNPATFQLDERKNAAGHYVQLAGGYKQYADGRNTYVIKANGSVVTRKMANINGYPLQPGDAVVVPQKIRFSNNFRMFVDTLSAIMNMTTIIVLITNLIVQMK